MNAQFVASFFIMLRKRHITKKECFVRYFSADFDNHFLSQKNIYDKLRKQRVFCREQINIMIIYIYAEKSNTLFSHQKNCPNFFEQFFDGFIYFSILIVCVDSSQKTFAYRCSDMKRTGT